MVLFQKGFNYAQDGQGNRLVYHLQGCNLSCPWCANPEGISTQPVLMADEKKLLSTACPRGAIKHSVLDRSLCRTCKNKACLADGSDYGLRLSGASHPIDALIAEALSCTPLFFDGGGVTLTGGEPTLQFDAVRFFFEKLQSHNIHTALETNATHPDLPVLFPLTDQLMMDIKHPDSATHHAFTGLGNERIKLNIQKAVDAGKQPYLRIPLIDGFNADAHALDGFLRFFSALTPKAFSVELLPFHEYGRDKWVQCGLRYHMQGGHVSTQTLQMFKAVFLQSGIPLLNA